MIIRWYVGLIQNNGHSHPTNELHSQFKDLFGNQDFVSFSLFLQRLDLSAGGKKTLLQILLDQVSSYAASLPFLPFLLFRSPPFPLPPPSPPPSSPPLSPTLDAIVIHATLVSGGCVCVGGEGGFKKNWQKNFSSGNGLIWQENWSNYFVELFWPPPHP